MNSPEITVQAFGNELGLKDFSLNAQGKITLETASGRRLSIESNDEHIVIYLSQIAQYNAAECLLQAWKKSHFSMHNDLPVHTGLRMQEDQQRLLALIQIPAHEFSLLRLQSTLEFLSAWLDEVQPA